MASPRSKKILLINPPWRFLYGRYKPAANESVNMPPLGLTYVAAYLKNKGYTDIRILDSEVSGYSIEKVVEYYPDVIGITCVSANFEAAGKIALEIKKNLKIPVILGGAHVSVAPVQAMKACSSFDYGVIGEGEITTGELLDAIFSGAPLHNIKGIIYRENGEIVTNVPREPIKDIDSLPFPERSLLNNSKYTFSVPGEGIIPLAIASTSRGCPFNCVFCASKTIWGQNVRFRSKENVLAEIEEIVNKFGIKYIVFSDDTFTLNRKRVINICEEITKRKLKFKWQMMTRADAFDRELLLLMKKAGLVRMSIGIESGDPEILKKIKKKVTLQEIKNAYEITSRAKIETRGSIMLGHPWETKKTAIRTLRFARKLKGCKQMYINIATPYPGTEFYDMAKRGEGGIKLLTEKLSDFRRHGNSVIDVNDLKRKDLIRLQKIGYWMFYMTPSRIWYNILRAGIPAGVRNTSAFLRSLLG